MSILFGQGRGKGGCGGQVSQDFGVVSVVIVVRVVKVVRLVLKCLLLFLPKKLKWQKTDRPTQSPRVDRC